MRLPTRPLITFGNPVGLPTGKPFDVSKPMMVVLAWAGASPGTLQKLAHGLAALHEAGAPLDEVSIDFGDSAMIDLLLKSGALADARTKDGLTALDPARKYQHTQLLPGLQH